MLLTAPTADVAPVGHAMHAASASVALYVPSGQREQTRVALL
jgi:hypothetical protein